MGAEQLTEGRNPISFCNVLFVANFIAGFTLFFIHRCDWNPDRLKKITPMHWGNMFFLALLLGVLAPSLFFIGLQLTEVINVVLISTIDIPLTLLFAWIIRREKPSATAILSSLLAIIGILTTFFWAQADPISTKLKLQMMNLGSGPLATYLAQIPKGGELCVVLAVFFTVFSVQYSRKTLRSVSIGIFSVFRMIMGSILFFLLISIFFGFEEFADLLNPFLLKWMLFYGIVIIGFGLYFWYNGINGTSAADLALANSFQPISGAVFAFLILGEIPSKAQITGGIIIVFAIVIGLTKTLYQYRLEKIGFRKPRGFTGV